MAATVRRRDPGAEAGVQWPAANYAWTPAGTRDWQRQFQRAAASAEDRALQVDETMRPPRAEECGNFAGNIMQQRGRW